MLALEGVRLSFGGAYALDRVDLTVAQGESVGLIGPNGSGKSSLFNVVTGIYAAGSGRVRVAGHDVTRLAPHRIVALGVARTVQTTRPFERLSVVDNVRAKRLKL
jgi:branched-chain amino acid transport system ATP-binding protein